MTFGIVGGDRRYRELARLLEEDGHTVLTCRIGGEGIEETLSGEPDALKLALAAETVILPLPLCAQTGYLNCAGKPLPIEEVLDLLAPSGGIERKPGADKGREADLKPGSEPETEPGAAQEPETGGDRTAPASPRLVLAGMVPESVRREAEQRGIRLVDYFQLETLAVANAAATADAALCLTVQHTGETLTGKRCLVLGFGRIGKLLCLRLRGLGASVTAAARKAADRAWVQAMGFTAVDIHALPGRLALPGRMGGFDIIYNTVPAPVLDQAALEELADAAPLLVELASRPGFDRDAAARMGLRVLHAPGLPGRLVPSTAAAALREAAYELLTEDSARRGSAAVYQSRNAQGTGGPIDQAVWNRQ